MGQAAGKGPTIDFERERILPFTPGQIWTVLEDFENHKIWNPYVRIRQLADDPVMLRYELRDDPRKPAFAAVPVRLLAAYPERLMTIDVRSGFLLSFEESYALSPVQGGTKIHHSYSCTGFLVWLHLPATRKRFETMIDSVDSMLLSYLERKYRRQPPRRPQPWFRSARQ